MPVAGMQQEIIILITDWAKQKPAQEYTWLYVLEVSTIINRFSP